MIQSVSMKELNLDCKIQTCTTLDNNGRPDTWVFPELIVKAEYFTQESNKLDFNKYIINANI